MLTEGVNAAGVSFTPTLTPNSRVALTPVDVDISGGHLDLSVGFNGGTIVVQGQVSLTPIKPKSIRGDVSGGNLELRPTRQGNYACAANNMDFAFTLTQVP